MESKRKNLRKNRGITLVALVITIIILLILAGISIAQLTGTGIFAKAEEAKQKYEEAEDLENQILANYEAQLNRLGKSTVGSGDVTGGGDDKDGEMQGDDPGTSENTKSVEDAKKDFASENTEVTDENGNTLVVPAGFKIAEDSGSNVTEGIVIEDNQDNQFVWIPVGNIKDKEGAEHAITLSRYTFDENGQPTNQGEAEIQEGLYKYIEEMSTSTTYKNAKARNLEEFKNSVETNHGYYIGRYEARTEKERKAKTDKLTTVTEKESDFVYNFINQPEASKQCKAMYSGNSNFTSDLMNSYAWDTAIVFLQEFDNRTTSKDKKYSRQNSLNTTFENKGTNNSTDENKKDKICNIYDMASNMYEYTTETYTGSSIPCTYRGGYVGYDGRYTSFRYGNSYSLSGEKGTGFRPLLYCSAES